MGLRKITEMSPEEVLMVAVDVEETNGTQLRVFADMFDDYAPEAAALFTEMAAEEDAHKAKLTHIFEERYGKFEQKLTEQDVAEVIEAHDIDDGEHGVFNDLTLRRAFECSLKAEVGAQEFYSNAADRTDVPEVKALFNELANFEDDHVRRLKERIAELGGEQ